MILYFKTKKKKKRSAQNSRPLSQWHCPKPSSIWGNSDANGRAKKIWNRYLSELDAESIWAKYIAERFRISMAALWLKPDVPGWRFLKMSLDEIHNSLGKPSRKSGPNEKLWFYDGLGLTYVYRQLRVRYVNDHVTEFIIAE